MRIGIDVRRIVLQGGIGGLATYPYYLVKALSKIDKKNEYLLLHNFVRSKNYSLINDLETENFINKVFIAPGDFLEKWYWKKFHIPIETITGTLDVFHQTYGLLPPQLWGKSIVTIHDLGHRSHPECLPSKWRAKILYQTQCSIKRADLIITVSYATKKEIVERLNVPEERIRVIYHGLDERFQPVSDIEILSNIKRRYKLPDEYILYVGVLDARKNLVRLIEAFYQFKMATKFPHRLVILGRKWGLYEPIFQKLNELKLNEEVVIIPEVSGEDMSALYSGAKLFILPSLVEGFGFPLLEAMACGTPVVGSNVTSIPEVIGDAGILVDPLNVEEIAAMLANILTDTILQTELREKGIKRTKLFRWEQSAQKHLLAYEDVYQR